MIAKSVAYVWVSLALFILVLYLVLRVCVMQSFVELERQNTTRNIARVLDLISEREATIDSKASDWSAWDDAYQFVQDGNPRFVQSNFALSAFTGMDLNLIAYLNNSEEIVYARWHEPGSDSMTPLPENIRAAIIDAGRLTTHPTTQSSVRGILMVKQGPMLVASRPVVTSNEQGPVRGSLIFGQLLGPREIREISRVTRVPIVVKRLDEGPLPAGFREARREMSESGKTVVQATSRRVVAGYATVDDIYGRPALIVRVNLPRSVYDRGLALTDYALSAVVAVSIVFGVIVSALLARTVRAERECDQKTIDFYRRTVAAATNGRLIITDRAEIEKMCHAPVARWHAHEATDMRSIRETVIAVASSAGIDHDRAVTFATCAGEALTNAIKHAGGGTASLYQRTEGILFMVSDQGPGIATLMLPDVALRRGYSTVGTLGMGYKVMVSLADRVYLATSSQGTTVAVEMRLEPEDLPVPNVGYIGAPCC